MDNIAWGSQTLALPRAKRRALHALAGYYYYIYYCVEIKALQT